MEHDASVVNVEGRDTITIALTADEAVVLHDWLSRTTAQGSASAFVHKAEQQVLWDIDATLERELITPLREDYEALVEAARERVGTVADDEA